MFNLISTVLSLVAVPYFFDIILLLPSGTLGLPYLLKAINCTLPLILPVGPTTPVVNVCLLGQQQITETHTQSTFSNVSGIHFAKRWKLLGVS